MAIGKAGYRWVEPSFGDHFSQEWTLRIEGKTTTGCEFERVKQAEGSSPW